MRRVEVSVILPETTTLADLASIETELRSYGSFVEVARDRYRSVVEAEDDWTLRGTVDELTDSLEATVVDIRIVVGTPEDVP